LDVGLRNKLEIVPTASGQSTLTISYSDISGATSQWIPTAGSAQPLLDPTRAGWRNIKYAGTSGASTKIEWFPYNPYFPDISGASPPSPPILKQNLNSLWAVIYCKNKINVQGTLFWNIYTYDASGSAAGWNNRWDYSIQNNPSDEGLSTGATTLNAGFRYLIYACDKPKQTPPTLFTTSILTNPTFISGRQYTISVLGTTNWSAIGLAAGVTPTIGNVFTYNGVTVIGTGTATTEIDYYPWGVSTALTLIGNGQFGTQTGFLRDPYDIYTDIPHIAFSGVLFNVPPGSGASGSSGGVVPTAASLNVPISRFCISTNSGTVVPDLDFTVEAFGYSANGGAQNFKYNLEF